MRRLGLVLLFGITCSVAVNVTPSGATTFNVNSSADFPDRDTNDGICEATFNVGDCTVRAAVMEANAQLGADTIQLQGGTTDLTQPSSPTDSESIGDLDITDDVTILGINPTTRSRLDGGGNVLNDRLLDIRAGATVVIQDVVLQGGNASGNGGGIRVSDSSSLTLVNSQVIDNRTAGHGGGISLTAGASLDVQESLVGDNLTPGIGGGIHCAGATLAITDSEVANNSAGAAGGLGLLSGCPTTIDGSTVSGNSATSTFWGGYGGGILIHPNASAIVTNSTISGNSSISNGGGLFVSSPYAWYVAYASLNNVTVAFNHANAGGGGTYAATSGNIDVENSILASNTAGTGAPDCGGDGIDSLGHNMIGDTTACTISGTTTGNVTNQAAELAESLALNDDNTGVTAPTRTHALLPGSPAINAGNNTTCEATDQRGVARPIPSGGACDMGAFEAPRCGDGVLNPPETCDDGNTSDGDGCLSTCQGDTPISGHNEPTVTAVTNGGLVVAYKDCESPYLATSISGPPACIPVRLDNVCYFQTGVTGARGDYTIKSVSTSGGRMLVDVDIVKLQSGCNGQTLRVSMALNETVEDCTGGGSCTVETRELDEDDLTLVSPSCVVAADKCTIRAELNSSASLPKVANGKRTGIEFRRFKIVRQLSGGGTVDSFVPGVFLP